MLAPKSLRVIPACASTRTEASSYPPCQKAFPPRKSPLSTAPSERWKEPLNEERKRRPSVVVCCQAPRASVCTVPQEPAAARNCTPRSAVCVTMLMAPEKAWVPSTRDAAPSSTSMRSMSLRLRGKSAALWPVCGLLMGMPLTRIVIWSKVPPLMPMSVCKPKPPRSRTSMPALSLSTSLILVTPAAASCAWPRVVTCRAARSAARGARDAALTASRSNWSSSSVAMLSLCIVWCTSAVDTAPTAAKQGAAVESVATVRTPTFTSRPSAAKSA